MTIREFRKNLSKYLKAIKDGEILEVGKIWIGLVEEPGELVDAEVVAPEVKEVKFQTPLRDMVKKKHHPTCPCAICK